jgi:hypothetical protein
LRSTVNFLVIIIIYRLKKKEEERNPYPTHYTPAPLPRQTPSHSQSPQ